MAGIDKEMFGQRLREIRKKHGMTLRLNLEKRLVLQINILAGLRQEKQMFPWTVL